MIDQILNDINDSPAIDLTTPLKDIPNGMIMEFGVASGGSINKIARNTDRIVYGFDSFEGLPEDWRPGIGKGTFKCGVPEVENNVKLIIGLFADTLPKFLEQNNEKVAFIHIDCDLYSSTKIVFDNLKNRIIDGTIIAFDEIRNYSDFENHEIKAFIELLQETNYTYTCIGNHGHEQAIFKMKVNN